MILIVLWKTKHLLFFRVRFRACNIEIDRGHQLEYFCLRTIVKKTDCVKS